MPAGPRLGQVHLVKTTSAASTSSAVEIFVTALEGPRVEG